MGIFPDNLNVAVFTVKQILRENKPVLYVFHDDENDWQFLPGDIVSTSDAMIVTLGQILEHDPSIEQILNLEEGYSATRESIGSGWNICKTETRE